MGCGASSTPSRSADTHTDVNTTSPVIAKQTQIDKQEDVAAKKVLTIEEVVGKAVEQAKDVEPKLTSLLKSLASDFGGEMLGLDYRFKTAESAARKLRSAIQRRKRSSLSMILLSSTEGSAKAESAKPELVAPEVLLDMLRYSYVFPTDEYVAATHELSSRLKTLGVSARLMKNYWCVPDDIYQGINSIWADEAGFCFELQIHTKESFACNEETHGEYEKYRVEQNEEKKRSHYEAICAAAAAVPVPEGVEAFGVSRAYKMTDPISDAEVQLAIEALVANGTQADADVRVAIEAAIEAVGGTIDDEEVAVTPAAVAKMQVSMTVQAMPWLLLTDVIRDYPERLRYVVVLDDDKYAASVQTILASLTNGARFAAMGDALNYWLSSEDALQGIIANFAVDEVSAYAGESVMAAARANRRVAIHFHTPTSAQVLRETFKPLLKRLLEYDQAKGAEADELLDEKLEVYTQMEHAWRGVPAPPGVAAIGKATSAVANVYEELQDA